MSDPSVIIITYPRKEQMKSYQVTYSATYWVNAHSEDEAIELGIEQHQKLPDGDWEAMIDPYDSNNFGDSNV